MGTFEQRRSRFKRFTITMILIGMIYSYLSFFDKWNHFFFRMISKAEWAEINRKLKEGSGEEQRSQKNPLEKEKTLSPKEAENKIKEHEQILIEMRKEVSSLGYIVSQHQSYFEMLQKLSEQQKIEIMKR